MADLQIFTNSEFGELGVLIIDGKEYFPATDCARLLGYSNPHDAIARHCKGCVKHEGVSLTTNQHGVSTEQLAEMNFIPEGDLYRLIARSRLPEAERFERWVFDEVLPSIRKHGGYLTPQKIEEALLNPDVIIRLATDLKAEREQRIALESRVEADRPKTIFADAVAASETSILIGDLAKILRQNGINIGQNRLFEILRQSGFLIKDGESKNMPTQRAMDMGLFEIKETSITSPKGTVILTKTPKVTGKGQVYFVNRFLKGKVPVGA